MPTKFKRYRCSWCGRTVVVWKLRSIAGKKFCPGCIDYLHEQTKDMYKNPPVKSDILAKAEKDGRIKKVAIQTRIPDFGG